MGALFGLVIALMFECCAVRTSGRFDAINRWCANRFAAALRLITR